MESMGSNSITFGDLFNLYMTNHAKPHCKSWPEFQRNYNLHLSHWHDRPAVSIKRFDVQQLHTVLAGKAGRTTANKMVQLISTVYNRGRDWEFVDHNPAVRIQQFRLESRDRFLEIEELERFFTAVRTLRYESTRDFLMMCLATAARRSNVASMRWDEVSFERSTWTIPGSKQKNGKTQVLPLTGFAMQILLRRKLHAKSDWVFTSERSPSGHLTKPEKAWSAVLHRASLANVRIHDLRRTLASYQAITGASESIIAKTLNHSDLKSVQIYARLNVDPVRRAMELATSKMLPEAFS